MERNQIAQRVWGLSSKEELLQLLNDLVKDEMGDKNAFEFSMKQLSYYCNPNNRRGRYHHFSISKKSGGERRISAPSKGLKNILYYVNIMLKAVYRPSDYAMGFTEGRSVADNAIRHIGQNFVFNTDLKDFFPSIEQPRVWKRLQLKPFNIQQPIANIIAGLCCIKEEQEDGSFIYVLPQGAPTSPLLTNAICDTLDRRLNGLAKKFKLKYTRYADDITFSSMHFVYGEKGDFRKELYRIISDQGFTVNENKTRLQKLGERQMVTGLVVSDKINVTHKYVSDVRNLLHIWEKYGYQDAYKKFYPRYKEKKGAIKKGEPALENVLYGKLQYLKMIKGEKDPVYSALQARYDKLTSPIYPEEGKVRDYLRAFTLEEFEEICGQKIVFLLSKKGNLYGKVSMSNQPVNVVINDEAAHFLVENNILRDENLINAVKDVKTNITLTNKPGLYIVLTAKNKKKPFWMMTYGDPTETELDLSNIPVQKLLDIWEKEGLDSAIKAYEEGITDNIFKTKIKNKKSVHFEFPDIDIEEPIPADILRQIQKEGIPDDVLRKATKGEKASFNFDDSNPETL